jgi:vacuolar-type H+-ATPase subunit I/STV1
MDFQPLQKHEVSMFLEPFVDNAQAKSLTETILIGIALMVFATIITFIFLSAYNKSKYLFIVVYSLMVLVYSIIMISLILMKKEVLSQLQYEMYMGSSLGIIIVAIIFVPLAVP